MRKRPTRASITGCDLRGFSALARRVALCLGLDGGLRHALVERRDRK